MHRIAAVHYPQSTHLNASSCVCGALTTCVRVMDFRKLTGVSFWIGSGDMSGRRPVGSTVLFFSAACVALAAVVPKGEAGIAAEVEALNGFSALTGAPKGFTAPTSPHTIEHVENLLFI